MSEARRFHLIIDGISPLIMNANTGMLAEEAEDKGRDKLAWERQHMLDKTYRDSSGDLVIQGHAIRKCLMNGCRFVTDKPKGSSFKSFGPLVEATLFVEEDARLNVPVDKVTGYVSVVNLNPSKGPKGPRGPRCRPMIPMPWRAETYVTLIDEAITNAHLATIADVSGRLVGLLDGRTIGFGRCNMTVKKA